MPRWRRRLQRVVLLALSGQLLAGAAHAQHAALDSLQQARAYIRLTTPVADCCRGRIARLDSDSVWLRYQRSALAVSDLRQIEARVYRADPLGNGVALGAIMGGVAGLFLPYACIGCEITSDPVTFILGGAVSGSIFGLMADLGHEEASWRAVWSKP